VQKVLEIHDLNIAFGDRTPVVQSVNFSLHLGKTLGVVGESGSGKSMTSLAIMGLLPRGGEISSGTIKYIHNKEEILLSELSSHEHRKYRGKEIAMIFQEPMTSLNPVFTCGNQVVEMLLQHEPITKAEAKTRTIELFKEVEIPRPESIFNQYPHQISGGQKQRVMIAMALSCNPKILIADEPTTALDVTVQKTILQLLKRLQEERGMSMIFISHDLGVVASVAHEIMVMKDGKVVEKGTPKEIFLNAQHPYTKGLIACRPPLNKRYTKLPTVADFLSLVEKEQDEKSFLEGIIEQPEQRKIQHQKLYEQEPVLQVKNVKTYYTAKKNWLGNPIEFVKAVNDVSFDVYPGETLGLIGESGCGKTTLGKTILRLEDATEGQIFYKGRDILEMNSEELKSFRKEVQIIFQDPYASLNPRKTIGEAIAEPMLYHGLLQDKSLKREKVEALLEKVGLEKNHYDRYPHEFSGGQRQRISIARTLAVEPKFIVCDESVSALDVSVQAQVLNLLNDLKAKMGLTYIFISHDLSVIKYMCDRMVVMNKSGQIDQLGESDEVYQNPATEYTRKLIDAIPEVSFD
jgi:peptide/nickel transport system ATP-binding protein